MTREKELSAQTQAYIEIAHDLLPGEGSRSAEMIMRQAVRFIPGERSPSVDTIDVHEATVASSSLAKTPKPLYE